MATGLNETKANKFKVELLDSIESINVIKENLTNYNEIINNNWTGEVRNEFNSKLSNILSNINIIYKNINVYISSVGKVVSDFDNQDVEIASQVSKNIRKLDSLKEE